MDRYDTLLAETLLEFPRLKIVETQYCKHAATTLGTTIYVRPGWHDQDWRYRYLIVRHERVHLRQYRRLTVPLFLFLYMLVLPIGLAYFRYRFEREAYLEELHAELDITTMTPQLIENRIQEYAGYLSGGSYFWAFPRSWVVSWFRANALKLPR